LLARAASRECNHFNRLQLSFAWRWERRRSNYANKFRRDFTITSTHRFHPHPHGERKSDGDEGEKTAREIQFFLPSFGCLATLLRLHAQQLSNQNIQSASAQCIASFGSSRALLLLTTVLIAQHMPTVHSVADEQLRMTLAQ
jgi:hypothetical protein